MTKLLRELYTIVLAPMPACPPGLEREWLKVVLEAMANCYRLQCRPPPNIDEVQLATLFDSLAEQWLDLRDLALARGVRLAPELHARVSVEEFRALFCEADALNILFPENAA